MTVARDVRNQDARKALLVLLKRLGDRCLLEGEVAVDDPQASGLLKTTWSSLHRCGYVANESVMGSERYCLTEAGWLKALEISNMTEDAQFHERVQRLLVVLKASVKGRDEEAFLDLRDLAEKANLPLGWVMNAIAADLLEWLYP